MNDVVSHYHITSTLTELIRKNQLPHLLFYGPPGTGKTSTIVSMARDMYGRSNSYSSMVLELNASDDRGIDVVREQIRTFASSRAIMQDPPFKLVILDEADSMTSAAQFALRRVIEKYTGNARFCLVCNYASKIIPAIQSRCTKFRFKPLPRDLIKARTAHVIAEEKLQVSDDALTALVRLAEGDMRRSINVLQAAAMNTDGPITAQIVFETSGLPPPDVVQRLLGMLLQRDVSTCHREVLATLQHQGLALVDLIHSIHEMVLQLAISPIAKAMLCRELATIEDNMQHACDEVLQTGSLVAAFTDARGRSGMA